MGSLLSNRPGKKFFEFYHFIGGVEFLAENKTGRKNLNRHFSSFLPV